MADDGSNGKTDGSPGPFSGWPTWAKVGGPLVAATLVIGGVAAGTSGGGFEFETLSPPSTTTTVERTTTTTAERTTTTVQPTTTTPTLATTTVPPSTIPPTVATTRPAPVSTASLMPDVVCMNLQDAQDRIQQAGVFYSRSFDATGEGRSQFIDSNWLVVYQEPAPGTPIGEGDPNLGAVKYGEPYPCGL